MTAITTPLLISVRCPAHADPSVSLAVNAEPQKITIGDKISYKIRVSHPGSLTLQPFSLSALGDFLVTDVRRKSLEKSAGTLEDEFILTLVTFSTGTVTIPAFALEFLSPQKQPLVVKTPEVPIRVDSVLDKYKNRGDIQEIKGQIGFINLIPWVIGLLGLAALGLILWLLHKRKTRQAALGASAPPPRPAEIVAREALAALESRRLIEEGRFKEFYVEFSGILRRYVENRFPIPCMDMTTSEMTRALRGLSLPSADFNNIRETLQDCDLVKFAKFVPSPDEPPRHIKKALNFIENTTGEGGRK
jgi:hypothetical protein